MHLRNQSQHRPKLVRALLCSLILPLSACSPHPGAGNWHAVSEAALFERLQIRFDGQADFFTRSDDASADWRCFWGALDKQTAQLQCVDAGNADNEQVYLFRVDANKEGQLVLGEKQVGRYQWQPLKGS